MPMMVETEKEIYVPLSGFGAAMKAARHARGLTQVQLAEQADVNPETIIRIEQGLPTRTTTMQKIRKVLPNIAPPNGQLSAPEGSYQSHAFISFAEQDRAEVDTIREQVIHLIRAIGDRQMLHQVWTFTLSQLNKQATKPEKRHKARKLKK